jgi:hypothetical protein
MTRRVGVDELRRALAWFVRDPRTGQRVVMQLPNIPILLYFATVAGRWFVDDASTLDGMLLWAGTILLAWWSVDEIVRGASPFRRVLGAIVAVYVVVGVFGRL